LNKWPTTSAPWPRPCWHLALNWCWRRLKNAHREACRDIAAIAYGKLGGKESSGYGSDLDIVFVYDDVGRQRAGEMYARAGAQS
jgi:glutamine synthetase adenylyltransferase